MAISSSLTSSANVVRPRGGRTYDVAIVGFGPVGATLAGLLGRRGLSVIVLDQAADVFPLPRAAHLDHTALRVLQELGCLDDLLPGMLTNGGLDFVASDGQLLMSVPGGSSSISGLPASVYFHQPLLDQRLCDVAAGQPTVTALRGLEASGVQQFDDRVVIDTVSSGGATGTIEASYLVGADGASSAVRELSGIRLEDLRFEERWLVVDLELAPGVDKLPNRAITVCDPARPRYLIPMPAPRYRCEFMLLADEDASEMERPERVLELVDEHIPRGQVRIERSATYTFHGLVAEPWRTDRVLIAGDAAHQMPPFLGQGMCSGLRDAVNLAWKLDRVISGAPDRLLDTYQSERCPHVRHVIEAAVEFGRVICTTDPAVAAARDAKLLGDPRPAEERAAFRLPPLTRGPLIFEGGGDLFPQPRVDREGLRLDDVVGQRFLVIAEPRSEWTRTLGWWREVAGALVMAPGAVPDPHGIVARYMAARDADFVIVRPDRYVLAAGGDLDQATRAAAQLLTPEGVTGVPRRSS
jgi:2-polyprenyl-6-methoxyphenol hydroxylase-like FAD-dependent oxidoreductase